MACKKEVKIDIKPEVLNQYQLSFQDIVNIIAARNIEIPAGTIDGETSINVKVSGRYEDLEDIKNTVVYISQETGGSVRLKDIADIYMGLEDANYKVKHNGENSVLLTGYFINNKNIVIAGKNRRNWMHIKVSFLKMLLLIRCYFNPMKLGNQQMIL